MGVDVAMLEETLQNLAAQTEEANNRILQVRLIALRLNNHQALYNKIIAEWGSNLQFMYLQADKSHYVGVCS